MNAAFQFIGEKAREVHIMNPTQLAEQLVWKPGEERSLGLKEHGRQLLYHGCLRTKYHSQLQLFLLDHVLLFTQIIKIKSKNQAKYKVYRTPIPLEILQVTSSEDARSTQRSRKAQCSHVLVRRTLGFPTWAVESSSNTKASGKFWINFVRLGRNPFNLMLWANTDFEQKEWLNIIHEQQEVIRTQSVIFEPIVFGEGSQKLKVNCAAFFDKGKGVAYGTDDGIYFQKANKEDPVKILALSKVTRIDILEDYQLLIVQSKHQVLSFPWEKLGPGAAHSLAGAESGKRHGHQIGFYSVGKCLGRTLVMLVKLGTRSSTIKVLEPRIERQIGRIDSSLVLTTFHEFYIPIEVTSVYYLKTRMCLGSSQGFQIIDLETLDWQGLLDPIDDSLQFLSKQDGGKAITMYAIEDDLLLCYNDVGIWVDKAGRRLISRDFTMHWEGVPTEFAFEPSFVEIWNIYTGNLMQVIQISNPRPLCAGASLSVAEASASVEGRKQDDMLVMISSENGIFGLRNVLLDLL
ncbi:hypothetical protein GYMLUDRAFT_65510 [Collybiopsis luxurians FD-317 M1]|uniref:CNH domain-containing protein n=1 Tax=Collybiopsis luxurians FD-317 M1 TaxID=944289 RepID=A0A0D0BK60_9AGAR|nr:hypothetical protein GYMLUDRAFT_65510 [Collybiopsis luxurians FD-317 M1]